MATFRVERDKGYMLMYYGVAYGSPVGTAINLVFGGLLGIAANCFLVIGNSYRIKVKRLKTEKGIME